MPSAVLPTIDSTTALRSRTVAVNSSNLLHGPWRVNLAAMLAAVYFGVVSRQRVSRLEHLLTQDAREREIHVDFSVNLHSLLGAKRFSTLQALKFPFGISSYHPLQDSRQI